MKKYLCLLALLFVCLTGCSSRYDEDAIQMYLDATQNFKQLESIHLDVNGNVYSEADKEQVNARFEVNGDMILAKQLQMALDFKVAVSGIALDDMHFYIKDNTMYIKVLDEKIKFSFQEYVDLLSALEGADSDVSAVDEESVKQFFKEFKFEDKEQGIISFTFDLDRLAELSGGMAADTDIKKMINSYSGTMKIKDNTLSEATFDLVITVEGEQYPISVTASFSKLNKVNKIKFPSFKDYKEQNTQLNAASDLLGEGDSDL